MALKGRYHRQVTVNYCANEHKRKNVHMCVWEPRFPESKSVLDS